jgi:hypothetical protein
VKAKARDLADAGLFSKIVDDVRAVALTTGELARVTGVEERQVYNWASGASRPRGETKDRLLEVHYIVNELREVYTPEGADIWIHARNRSLRGAKPIDLLIEGDFEAVLAAIERLKTGAM